MAWCSAKTPPPSPAPDYGLALAEARRRLDSQLSIVDASRGRVTSLLGVAGLVGTFVGGLGTIQTESEMTNALWVAASAFAVAVAAGLLILVPWKFHGDVQAETLVGWTDDGHSRHVQERDLALRVETQFKDNTGKAAALQWGLILVVLAVAVEFGALAYQLIRST
jgi:hypothetical protein